MRACGRAARASRGAGALALSLLGASLAGPAPQSPPPIAGGRVAVSNGGPIGRYEAMYGSPEFRGIDDDQSRPWPMRQAIRTVGRLEEIAGRGNRARSGTDAPQVAMGREWDSAYALYEICGERFSIALVPVIDLQDVFAGGAASWIHHNVEVIGAIDKLNLPGVDPTKAPVVFQVWSVFEAPERPGPRKDSQGSTLEPLVRYPKGAEGRVVTVSGVFRGANLFEDLPPESRRDGSDWVLQDGPFSIWVTGKPPRGKGFSLDPSSRADCRFRLEVKGKVMVANDYVYLRASSLQLLGRARVE